MNLCLLYVVDTSDWIDLYYGELLDEVFSLPIKLISPDVIVEELKIPPGRLLMKKGLIKKEMTPDEVVAVFNVVGKYSGVSVNDLFALVLAKNLKAVLLTNDNLLRKVAVKEGVTVHGILWLLDYLVEKLVVSPQKAAFSLRSMLKAGSRLPEKECQHRIKLWNSCYMEKSWHNPGGRTI